MQTNAREAVRGTALLMCHSFNYFIVSIRRITFMPCYMIIEPQNYSNVPMDTF